MRALLIQISIALLTLIVPEIWKDTFEWLRRTPYWRYIQIAVVAWIVVTVCVGIPWGALIRWGIQNRTIATTLSAVVGAFIFGIVSFVILSRDYPANSVNPPSGVATSQPTPASIRLKYSSRQTLQLSPVAAPSDQVLNLDNTASLRLHVPYDLQSVTLALPKDVPLTIAEPKADRNYKTSGGTLTFPSAGKGMEIKGVAAYSVAATYHFTTVNRVQIIRVKDRAFRVALDEINDMSTKDIPRTDYVFAISEESVPASSAQPPKEERAVEQPYIYAKLSIEPADKGSARLRVQIENGKVPVENVRVTKKAHGYTMIEYHPISVRMIAPGGKLSDLISPIPLKPNEYGTIAVEIYFDATINGAIKHFIASHRFLLQPEDIKPQTIDPESSNYREGTLEAPQQTGEIVKQLAEPQGTVFTTVPEKNGDDTWNTVRFGNEQRRFLFDPEARLISFYTKTASGRVASISEPMQSNAKAMHIVMVTWNPYGGSLSVDGIEHRDFDQGHDHDQR